MADGQMAERVNHRGTRNTEAVMGWQMANGRWTWRVRVGSKALGAHLAPWRGAKIADSLAA